MWSFPAVLRLRARHLLSFIIGLLRPLLVEPVTEGYFCAGLSTGLISVGGVCLWKLSTITTAPVLLGLCRRTVTCALLFANPQQTPKRLKISLKCAGNGRGDVCRMSRSCNYFFPFMFP